MQKAVGRKRNRIRRKAHLADARGWLDNDDPFFTIISHIIANRLTYQPYRLMWKRLA